ncbi:MAG: hypothetical protein P8Y69_03335 [Gammaproteobacteria bacterium]
MKRLPTQLAVLALAALIVGWQIHRSGSEDQRAASLAAPMQAPPTPTSGADPRALARTETAVPPSSPEQARPADEKCVTTFHPVNGLEVRDCSEAEPTDPYETWDEQTLADMAYGDAHAAEVLGLRHITSDNPRTEALGLMLIYRAVALSGDPVSFRKAIGARYAYLEVNGKPQIDNLKQLLIFNLIGEKLGDSRFDSRQVVAELKRVAVPDAEIDRVTSAATRILERMAETEGQVTGNTAIREALENA